MLAAPLCAQEHWIEETLTHLRAAPGDLGTRPERRPVPMSLEPAELALKDPASLPRAARDLAEDVHAATGLDQLERRLAHALGSRIVKEDDAAAAEFPIELPRGVAGPARHLWNALVAARGRLARAGGPSPEEAKRLEDAVTPLLVNRKALPPDESHYALAGRFPHRELLLAADRVLTALEPAVVELEKGPVSGPMRLKRSTPHGAVLVSREKEAVFTEEDLKDVSLLLHWGESSSYEAAPARARAGEVKVVVDFAPNVTARGDGAATGVFGVGVLVLPSAKGAKVLVSGDVSLGAGLFGAGVLQAAGKVTLKSGAFAQGAAAFGLGLVDLRGDDASLSADYAAQGFAFTRGAGLLRLKGSGADLGCGLKFPDPHEPQAALSLCQGMGFGPRSYAGGGLGLLAIEGDKNRLRSGYFSQGSGYWRSLGVLSFKGNDGELFARRYGQGAGVHFAAGALLVDGDRNKTTHWGAGPAIGWDYGVGSLDVRGDKNTLYSAWATGRGDANGHAFARVEGAGNRMSLPDFASGYTRRSAPSFAVARVSGKDNRLRFTQVPAATAGPLVAHVSPWGALSGDAGLVLDPALDLGARDWPQVPREAAVAEDRAFVEGLMKRAEALPEAERPAAWLEAIGAAEFDAGGPREAARKFLSLPAERVGALVPKLHPDRYGEMKWAWVFFPAFGPLLKKDAARCAKECPGLERFFAYGMNDQLRAEEALPALVEGLTDADWRLRRSAASLLGALFGRETGEETGRLAFLTEASGLGEASADAPDLDARLARLGNKTLPELYALLALDESTTPAERVALFDATPSAFDTVPLSTLKEFARLLRARGGRGKRVLEKELASASAAAPAARAAVLSVAADADVSVRAGALASLGRMGSGEDAPLLCAALADPAAEVREAASLGLAKMGVAAKPALEASLKDSAPRTRAYAALAAARSSSPEVIALVGGALKDPDADVRRAAAAALTALQSPLIEHRKPFRDALRALIKDDPDAGVRATAAYAETMCR